jgi:hypothetical protein
MKYFSAYIYFLILFSFLGSCKKDINNPVEGFDYERAAGLWVPYEVTDEFGTVHPGPFTANSMFGSYAESVQLKSDKTFIPVTWFDKNSIVFKIQEAGTFEYLSGNKLRFKGLWEAEWEIDKFEGDELWLRMHAQPGDVLYKFQRQQ